MGHPSGSAGPPVPLRAVAKIHLTFDNGPHPEGTPQVLRTLADHGVGASFFVLGRELDRPRGFELALQIRSAGHRLGNHSYSHATPLGEDPRDDAVELELERTQALLDRVGSDPVWFRPFGGGGVVGPHLLSRAAVAWLVARKATCVLWSSVPGDWLDPDGWVEPALADADEQDHAVVVLHDAIPEATRHLGRFIDRLKERGHTFTDAIPKACLPIDAGVIRPSLEGIVAPAR